MSTELSVQILEGLRQALPGDDPTWTQLADVCGVTPQAINSWRKRREPRLNTLNALLAAYNDATGIGARVVIDGEGARVEVSSAAAAAQIPEQPSLS